MNERRSRRILSTACVFALLALALMVWSLFDPRPIPVIVAMSVGQVLGTLSFASFVYVMIADLRRGPAPSASEAPKGEG